MEVRSEVNDVLPDFPKELAVEVLGRGPGV